MENIVWNAGSEKRFSEFISKFNDKDKIAIISHTDLDGISAAKITNQVVEADFVKLINYNQINEELVLELKKLKIKMIIFTDLYFKDTKILEELTKFSDILIIDHHPFMEDFNSEKIVFLNSNGYCATYLSYYLFSKVRNIEKYDWLVASASIADYCFKKNTDFLIETYKKYNDKFKLEGDFINTSGKIWELQYKLSLFLIYHDDNLIAAFNSIKPDFNDIKTLEEYSSKVEKEVTLNIEIFEREKIDIQEGYFFEVKPKFHIKSFLINKISMKYIDKTIVMGVINGELYSFSMRRQDGKIDLNKLAGKIIKGLENSSSGGHFKAIGGFIQLKDKEKFIEKLKNYK